MKIKSYEEAVEYLESFIGKVRFEITPEFLKHHDPLERMRVLLSLLGNPQDKFKSVLVGGTSGKGSTAYLISRILTTAGYETGLTLSPHLQRINERLQINGKPISDKEFAKMVGSIVDTIELMKKMPIGEPSYFEILIAMAFLHFVQEKVDIAVVEVGMGGEFDATNTLYPLIAVLTNVSLDHTNVLGGTVQKIARTKAGIIKKNQESGIRNQGGVDSSSSIIHDSLFMIHFPIVITGVKQPSVIKIIEDRCKEVGAELFRLGKDLPALHQNGAGPAARLPAGQGRQGFNFEIKKESLEGSVFDLTIDNDRGLQLNDLKLSLLGEYQVENASLAIETVLQLRRFGFRISEENIKRALKTAFFPGRFEIVNSDTKILRYKDIKRENGKEKSPNILISQYPNIQIVLDGAHNPTKMKAFLSTLKDLFPKQRKIFVVGFKFDKDIPKMLKQITKVADILIITKFKAKTDISTNASIETKRILEDIKRLRSASWRIKKIIVEHDSRKALDRALSISISLPADATHQALQAGQYPNISAIIVVTGSLYLVGEARDYLMKNPKS